MNPSTIIQPLAATFAVISECKGRFFNFLVACLLVAFSGPVRSDVPDLFSGVYVEIPGIGYKEDLYYTAIGPNEITFARNEDSIWAFSADVAGTIDPSLREWRQVAKHMSDTLFDKDTPRIGIVCITPQKAENYGPFFCQIPIGTIFGFRENGSSFKRMRSNSGYFMAIGTFAGVLSPEFRKLR